MLVILICLKYEIPNKLSNGYDQLFKWKKGK